MAEALFYIAGRRTGPAQPQGLLAVTITHLASISFPAIP
ncbi:hypothetical protein KVC_2822 [Ketogulonicigenium vulgare]|nr:hypothetical protein KVC_2822 [Ketogulonicigenium vulgare]